MDIIETAERSNSERLDIIVQAQIKMSNSFDILVRHLTSQPQAPAPHMAPTHSYTPRHMGPAHQHTAQPMASAPPLSYRHLLEAEHSDKKDVDLVKL